MIRLSIKAQCDQCDAECDGVLVVTLGPVSGSVPVRDAHAIRPNEVTMPQGWSANYDSRSSVTRIHCPAHPART